MKVRSVVSLWGLVLLIGFSLGCAKAGPMVIRDFGPTKTKAGQVFNAQPGGVAAIWIKADNVADTAVVVWGEKRLPSFKQTYGMSATVPKELYAVPGEYQIFLLDTKTGAKSKSVTFTVE
jgi:hypothetical protein